LRLRRVKINLTAFVRAETDSMKHERPETSRQLEDRRRKKDMAICRGCATQSRRRHDEPE